MSRRHGSDLVTSCGQQQDAGFGQQHPLSHWQRLSVFHEQLNSACAVLQALQATEASAVASGFAAPGGFAMAVAEPESDEMSAADLKVR